MPSHLRFAILGILAYVAAAWAVRLDLHRGRQIASLVYPLDTFSMYATGPGPHVSQLLLRDRQGRVHRVTDFDAFACSPLQSCADAGAIPYHDADLLRHIQLHALAAPSQASAVPMDLVRRTWTLRAWTSPRLQGDCTLASCAVLP